MLYGIFVVFVCVLNPIVHSAHDKRTWCSAREPNCFTHSLIHSHQGYKFSKRLYTLINVVYTCGDVLGRALTSFERLKRPTVRTMILLTVVAFAVYGMLLFAACAVDSFERTILPGEVSNILIVIFFT